MNVVRRLELGFAALLTAAAVLLAQAHPAAAALSTKECSAKYRAAKAAGTLNGQSYKAFRAAQCESAAAATPAATRAATTSAAAGSAVFPSAVSPKYKGESAAQARLHTCLDQYKANKARNANGGLKWIQKGGGYYSVCNARLKR
jgi:hypothetical protein